MFNLQRPAETPDMRLQRARTFWPDVDWSCLLCIEPIGSRHDVLMFDRRSGRCATGTKAAAVGNTACFEGDLTDMLTALQSPKVSAETALDYRAAVAFLQMMIKDDVEPTAPASDGVGAP